MLTDDVARLSSLRVLDPHEALVLVDVEPDLRPLLGWSCAPCANCALLMALTTPC